jgi:1-acyl-sn-glycerol-3-phosphate acyltransferase
MDVAGVRGREAMHDGLHDALPARTLERNFLVRLTRGLIRCGYLGLEVDGGEHLPADGRAVYALNHAGWFPLDAFMVGITVAGVLGPEAIPWFAAHDRAMATPLLGPFLRRAGALPAAWFRRPERLPAGIRAVGICPEGARGNTKPFWQAYRMKRWSHGFVRAAAALGTPVIPTAVVGAEECLPVAWTVKCLRRRIGAPLGLPVLPFPLPSRWRITFLPPVAIERGPRALWDARYCESVALATRDLVQSTLDAAVRERPLARLSYALRRFVPHDT